MKTTKRFMKGKIFNVQEVQAMLNGSKVMFREVIKFSKNKTTREFQEIALKKISEGFSEYNVCLNDFFKCHYQAGQKIFCKETFEIWDDGLVYKADNSPANIVSKWKPAQHMKQEHSRLTLLIKEIKVERLAEISEQDARKEGIIDGGCCNCGESEFACKCTVPEPLPVDAFFFDWHATHKKPEEKFESNPWVWCVSFEVIKN